MNTKIRNEKCEGIFALQSRKVLGHENAVIGLLLPWRFVILTEVKQVISVSKHKFN